MPLSCFIAGRFAIPLSNHEGLDLASSIFPVDIDTMLLVRGESFNGEIESFRALHLEWPVLVILIVNLVICVESLIERIATANHLSTLGEDAIVMLSDDKVDNLVIAVAEPGFVHLHELQVIVIRRACLGRTPLVRLVATVMEETVIMSDNDSAKLPNDNFLDVSASNSLWELDLSEFLQRLLCIVWIACHLDVTAHTVDGPVSCDKGHVI